VLPRADGTYARTLAKIARTDVLVIDDFAMTPITDAERRDLFEVLDDRHGNRATIISSQTRRDMGARSPHIDAVPLSVTNTTSPVSPD